MNKKKNPDFEEALQNLEKITDILEQGDLSLADAMHAYEGGLALSEQCRDILESAEKRLEVLEKTKNGEWNKKKIDWSPEDPLNKLDKENLKNESGNVEVTDGQTKNQKIHSAQYSQDARDKRANGTEHLFLEHR